MDNLFSPEISDTVARARQHALGDLLLRTAQREPDKTAVVAGDLRVTYREFDIAVNRAANAMAAHGLAKGDRLALLSRNCWQFAVLTFATARLGVVLVPINFMLTADEICYILRHCGASGLVVEDTLEPTASAALRSLAQTGGLDDFLRVVVPLSGDGPPHGWFNFDRWWTAGDDTLPAVAIADDDPLRLMYTSGTESRPKGVMLSSRSLITQYVSCAIDCSMSADDIEVHSLPMYHCAQLDCFFCVDVYLGATSIILPSADPATVLAAIETERATKLFAPPTVWISLLRHPDFDRTDLSSLQKGYYGASAMPPQVLRELLQRAPGVRLWNLYGQTEMSPLATLLRPHEQVTHPGSAGRVSINVQTRVVDDSDIPVPAGQVGEIVHRSPHVALGYYNDEEKTAQAFRNGWFHSGDLGILTDDGYLFVVDRKKDMIKTGGENVASREVEETIYELEGVAEAAVFGISHSRWIEAVTAVVVPKPGVSLTPDEVLAHARTSLASYKCPKYVVITDALPKNPSGKILKRELRIRYADLAEADAPPVHHEAANPIADGSIR